MVGNRNRKDNSREATGMSNHENEEILERIYEEEYERLRKRYPQFNEASIEILAKYFATKIFGEME
jgi:hypothetical protein